MSLIERLEEIREENQMLLEVSIGRCKQHYYAGRVDILNRIIKMMENENDE